MDGVSAAQLLQAFGPAGLFIAYLILQARTERADRREKEEKDRAVIMADVASRTELNLTLRAMTEKLNASQGGHR